MHACESILFEKLLLPSMKKRCHNYILYWANDVMSNILEKIKRVDGFILGTLSALFLTIAVILYYATMGSKWS